MSDIDSKPVVILGCGPAGLFAAQAVTLSGGQPLIFSKKKKSEIYGAQYLHRPIPGFSLERVGRLRIFKLGEESEYAQRIYGDPALPTSWSKLPEQQDIWDLREAYENAWHKFKDLILDTELDFAEVEDMTARFPVVISTIPLWSVCKGGHRFNSIPILVNKKVEYSGLPDYFNPEDNFMIYNGTEYGDWYRTSQIFGHASTEMIPSKTDSPNGHFELGFKVAGNECDCHPNMIRAGRMGTWERGVLTHHAFEKAIEAFADRLAV